jgi:DNA invertase Pin-like site-specific DNA recombinase
MMVLHKCDNRQCVNPEHLYLGTHSDNMRDRKERARTTKGEKAGPVQYPERFKGSNNPASKLTEADVLTIRGRKERGDSYAAIARDYEVSKQAIYLIVKRKNWHWV